VVVVPAPLVEGLLVVVVPAPMVEGLLVVVVSAPTLAPVWADISCRRNPTMTCCGAATPLCQLFGSQCNLHICNDSMYFRTILQST